MLIVAILSCLLSRGLSVTCPTKQFIERMSNDTVYCYLHTSINRCYWYLGPTSQTDPILKLEDGTKGGDRLKDDHYDITSECEMRIIHADIKHEATYTYVAILSNGSIWREDISVAVTVTTTPLCPRVSSCMLCRNCTLEFSINVSSTLACYINDVRPPVPLYWIYDGNDHVISNNKSLYVPSNPSNETWNSTAILEYTLTCGEDFVLTCKGKAWNKLVSTTVRIKSEGCDDDTTSVNTCNEISYCICSERQVICWIFLGMSIIVIAGIILMTIRIMQWIKDTCTIRALKRELKVIYSENLIPGMEHLSTECHCALTNQNFKVKEISSKEILTSSFIANNHRVLFKGKAGVGKSFLFQQLIHRWITNCLKPDIILIYFRLKYLSSNSSILYELMQTLGTTSTKDLRNILKHHPSLVLLDGSNDLCQELQSSNETNESNGNEESILAVENLLKNTHESTFPKMKVWVTSRIEKSNVENPDEVVTLTGFTNEETDAFFERSSAYYESMQRKGVESKQSEGSEITEGTPFLENHSDTTFKIDEEWKSGIRRKEEQQEGEEKISPLVAHLFVFNFFNKSITGEQIFPNSKSRHNIRFEKNISVNNIFQVNCHLLACLFQSCDQVEWKKTQAKNLFEGKDVMFVKGKHGYRREAAYDLCMTCRDLKVRT